MDLIGLVHVESIVGKRYIYVCVDDFSIFSWTNFLREKSKAFEDFEELWLKLIKEHNHRLLKITKIRSDHGKQFENNLLIKFCIMKGI